MTEISKKTAYFHSLSKVMTNSNQTIDENKYRSSHNISISDVWSSTVPFAKTIQEAYTISLTDDSVKYYDKVSLIPVFGSNGQTYCYIENGAFDEDGKLTPSGVFTRPLIGPEDVYNKTTNEISLGYKLKLYRGDDATNGTPNSEINVDEGEWFVNYYTGTIHFSEENTPVDLGWGSIKATFFKYTGNYVDNGYGDIFKSAIFEDNKIIFNKNTSHEQELDLDTLILTKTIVNVSLNPSKELVLTKNDDSTFVVDLKPIINDLVDNITFVNNKLLFYKNNDAFLEVDINELLLNYNGSFVDVDIIVDEEDNDDKLIFTSLNGATQKIELTRLQDRSAYNRAELKGDILKLTKQTGDITDVDLNSLRSNEGSTSVFGKNNINMQANNTSYTQKLACNTPISSNINGSNVLVFINGIQAVLGDNNDCECYFSNDGGITKKPLNDIVMGDKLYWTYNNYLPYAEYDLSTVDKITFSYLNVL